MLLLLARPGLGSWRETSHRRAGPTLSLSTRWTGLCTPTCTLTAGFCPSRRVLNSSSRPAHPALPVACSVTLRTPLLASQSPRCPNTERVLLWGPWDQSRRGTQEVWLEAEGTHLKMWSRGRTTGSMASGSFSLFSSKMAWKERQEVEPGPQERKSRAPPPHPGTAGLGIWGYTQPSRGAPDHHPRRARSSIHRQTTACREGLLPAWAAGG